jgi:hypothetical protein
MDLKSRLRDHESQVAGDQMVACDFSVPGPLARHELFIVEQKHFVISREIALSF